MAAFRFIDLFAGVGGFHHALSASEFDGQCVFASDIDEDCRKVYTTYFSSPASSQVTGDIRALTRLSNQKDRPLKELAKLIPDHEVLCAGFPCQPFSKSGAQQGVLDTTRGTLFFDIMRIVQAKKPQYIILENVRNLAGPRHTKTWDTIISSLRSLNYRVSSQPLILSPHKLPPSLGGTPQSRERVFILARRIDPTVESLSAPPLITSQSIPSFDPDTWDIHDFLLPDKSIANLKDYRLSVQETAWINAWQAFVQGISANVLPGFPLWVDEFKTTPDISSKTPAWKATILRKNSEFYIQNKQFIDSWSKRTWIAKDPSSTIHDFPPSRRKFEWQARTAQPTRVQRDLWQLTLHFRPSGIRVKPASYLPALVAITQTSIIGSRKRRITPLEAARLQAWPDDLFSKAKVSDKIAYKQAGNGVHSGVVKFVAQKLFQDGGHSWGRASSPTGV